ncbi:hypothetical protein N7468_002452 [Penicillium chermesinum]|uniref:Uncharacterized protein n=1 Tax=Penicillium chermesinum TaxID=63820 RepID=A0A9W9PIS2_9EURO|nr:uncharacterized protein N7468_002452 [Penicillium chermesinum]KAJ5247469.1 hypothetical protein N7468_002452 [Penicillium chermesinum]KAJ6145708.1 hypothetical protein N7470_009603 [Penicillium chermesinum]
MKLEAQDPQDGAPSPIAHILVQCQLGLTVTRLDPAPEGAVDTSKAGLLKELVTEWLGSLPPAYRETDPDTRWDDQLLYIPLQRRQLHAIGYMTMFGPFKPYLTKVYDSSSTGADRASREAAVDVGLHLMTVSRRLFDQVFPINAKFHIVTFLIFDTAAFLCSAIIHDKDHSLPRHEEVFRSVRLACSLVKQLSPITKTAAICYPVLTKLANSLRKPAKKASPGPVASDSISQLDSLAGLTPESSTETISPDALGGSSESIAATDVFFPASLDFPVQAMLTPPITGVSDFSDMDIGQFDQIWDWQDLDLNFLPEMPVQ